MTSFASLAELTAAFTCRHCNGHGYLGGGRRTEDGRPYAQAYARRIENAGHACSVCGGTGVRPTGTIWCLDL